MTADDRGDYTKAAGLGATALLASPRGARGTKFSGKSQNWATGAVVVAIAIAGAACSPPSEGSGPNTEPTEASQLAAAKTLPGRVNNALQLVQTLIRDDLYNDPAHRDDYETAMLSNELKQNEDWGTLAFEAIRAEREGRSIENLAPLMTRASVYQRREFPRYRAGYAVQAHSKVWEDNIAVSVRGNRNSILRLTGGVFATNRNIADMHRILLEGTSRVRFKRIEYQVYQGGPLSYFDLDTPEDAEVGVWVGSAFMSATEPGPVEEASMLKPRTTD